MEPHRRPTILVVDDDAALRKFSVMLLRKCGFRTLEAFDGQSGLSTFLKYRDDVDLVLTDVAMPEVSGPEMVERIFDFNPSVKVVFMSGAAGLGDVLKVDGRQLHILHKPFTAGQLAVLIRECLEKDA